MRGMQRTDYGTSFQAGRGSSSILSYLLSQQKVSRILKTKLPAIVRVVLFLVLRLAQCPPPNNSEAAESKW